jgi:hypothetical protein
VQGRSRTEIRGGPTHAKLTTAKGAYSIWFNLAFWQSCPSSTLGTGTERPIQIGVAVLDEVALLVAAAAYGDRGQADCRRLPATHLGLDHAPLMRAAAEQVIGCHGWRAGTENFTGKGRFDVS